MAKRLRSEEEEEEEIEEREAWWSAAKRTTSNDDDEGNGRNDDILALLFLDADSESPSSFEGVFAEEAFGSAVRVRFADDPYRSSPAGVFQTAASSYVTINGNDETCGSSFSDSESSVMASVDVGGLAGGVVSGFFGGACAPRAEAECGDGAWDCDDVSLARFLDEVLSSEQPQWMV